MFPDSKITVRRDTLTWIGLLRPSDLSHPYVVRITYKLRHYPQVRVLDPPIIDQYDFVPHVYNTGDLCVHEDHDWTPAMLLIDTVLAWAVEWLYFWELFLATGHWYGDGVGSDESRLAPVPQTPGPDETN